MNIGAYAKAITYIALAAGAFLVTALTDNSVSLEEGVNLAIVVVGAVGVYWAPNIPEKHLSYFKSAVAFTVAGLTALVPFLIGGVNAVEWIQVGIAALAAIGVTIVPNVEAPAIVEVETLTLQE